MKKFRVIEEKSPRPGVNQIVAVLSEGIREYGVHGGSVHSVVLVSQAYFNPTDDDFGKAHMIDETFVFGYDLLKGKVANWSELPPSHRDNVNPREFLENLGYKEIKPENEENEG